MTSVYSFGEASPLKFHISDKLANDYNEYVAEFLAAQRRFMQKFGRPWDYEKDPIAMKLSRRHFKAIKQFGKVLASTAENDGRYSPNEILDDFLVRNVISAAPRAVTNFDRAIGIAVTVSFLYVALRGLQRHF
jgi:hypothetical protein